MSLIYWQIFLNIIVVGAEYSKPVNLDNHKNAEVSVKVSVIDHFFEGGRFIILIRSALSIIIIVAIVVTNGCFDVTLVGLFVIYFYIFELNEGYLEYT